MPYQQMLEELTEYELDLYSRFYQSEPWGLDVQQTMFAQLQATIYNASGNLKKPLSYKDFLPGADDDVPLTPETFKAILYGDKRLNPEN